MSMIRNSLFNTAMVVLMTIIVLLCAVGQASAANATQSSYSFTDPTARSTISPDVILHTETYPLAGEEEVTATRTLPGQVQFGALFTVEITTNLYNGAIEEKLPLGFQFAGVDTTSTTCTMITNYHQDTNTVDFVYLGTLPDACTPATFSYKVIASNQTGLHLFDSRLSSLSDSGTKTQSVVGGDVEIEVTSSTALPANIKAKRTLPAAILEPGVQFEVNIEFTGITPGGVTENLPEGFTYVDGSESDSVVGVENKGDRVIFGFINEPESFSYSVTASSNDGTYEFSGTAKGRSIETGDEVQKLVTGDTTVVVQSTGEKEPLTLTTSSAEPSACDNTSILNGAILSMGGEESVTVSFDWGKTDAYGKTVSVGNMIVAGGFSATIENLEEGATYHFRAKAVLEGVTAYGPDRIFTMEKCPDETTGTRIYQLTTTVLPTGAGTVDVEPAGPEYESGTSITLKATANSGYAFDQWSGYTSSEENPTTITVSSNASIFANFVKTTVSTTPTPTPEDTPTPSVTPSITPTPTQTTTPTPTKTTSQTGSSDNGKPSKTYNITDIGAGNGSDSNGDDGDDEGGGTNLWVIIGPLLGVAVLGCILAYYLVGRKPSSEM